MVLGGISMAIALAMTYAGGFLLGGVPYPPAGLASIIIRSTPGDLVTAFIERLQHWAMILLGVAVHAGVIGLGAVMSSVVHRAAGPSRKARRALASAALLFVLASGFALLAPEAFSISAIAVYAISAAVFARLVAEVPLLSVLDPELRAGETPLDAMRSSRRRFIVGALGAAGGLVVGGLAVSRFLSRKSPMNVAIAGADERFARPPEDPDFPKLEGMTPEITSNDAFYTVDINPFSKPSVDHETWKLEVTGEVNTPYSLTYRELQEDFEVVEMVHTLTCISNEVGGDLISTAVWRGIRLKDVLERAGLTEGVVDVVFHAAEGYSDSIPLAKATEDTTLVVFGMNGVALPRSHGFPARIIVPGIYGMKNVKWLTKIEAVNHDYQGYWMVRGWSDIARVKTQSRIDVPADGRSVSVAAMLGGIAWAGDRGVKQVEVSQDGGKSWRPAVLKREMSERTWRLWAAEIEPGKGTRRVLVRAMDTEGELQESRPTRPHPDGAAGYDAVVFEVE